MDELIRKALLGNKEAQEECTNKGIILPCPKCHSEMFVYGSYIQTSPEGYENQVTFKCSNPMCGLSFTGIQVKRNDGIVLMQDKSPLAQWNDRPVPPVGRCLDCGNSCPGHDGSYLVCCMHGHSVKKDDWCNDFEKKEEEYG